MRVFRLLNLLIVPILFLLTGAFLGREFSCLRCLLSLVVSRNLLLFFDIVLLALPEERVRSRLARELLYLMTSVEIVILIVVHYNSRWSCFHWSLLCRWDNGWRRFDLHWRLCTASLYKSRKRSLNRGNRSLVDFRGFWGSVALISLACGSRFSFGSFSVERFVRSRFSHLINSFVS